MKILLIVLLISVFLVALCFAGLSLNILLRKNGKFPETEVGANKNMRRLGLSCTKQEELSHWKKQLRGRRKAEKMDCGNCTDCTLNR